MKLVIPALSKIKHRFKGPKKIKTVTNGIVTIRNEQNDTDTEPNKSLQSFDTISHDFGLRRFGSDVLLYSAGSALLLLFGFVQILIIPKYLSVEGYGYWQLFTLYGTYVGVLHLGFIDGILVRWAGKEFTQVSQEIKIAFSFLFLQLIAVTIPLGLVFYFLLAAPLKSIALLVLAYAFIFDLATFFIFTSQAVRKFRMLTAVNVGRGAAFLLIIVALFASGYLGYHSVILAFLAAHFLALVFFAFWFRKYLGGKIPSLSALWVYGRKNINIGIFVLLGNFVLVLFLTIDRLMVSSLFQIEQFAVYAFALMIGMVAYTFIQAVSQVFFPYLSAATNELRIRAYQLAKPAIILAWAAMLTLYFPLTQLVEFYLPRYVASLPIMQILLCLIGFSSLIQILHINIYKAYRKQKQYFFWGIISLALSAFLNMLAIKVFGTLESVAIATVISFGVWYIINELNLKVVVRQSNGGLWKGVAAFISYLSGFWLASFVADWFITQMLIYIGFFFLIGWLLFGPEIRDLLTVAKGWREQREAARRTP